MYGIPFESELFDIDPPEVIPASSNPVTFASVCSAFGGAGPASGSVWSPCPVSNINNNAGHSNNNNNLSSSGSGRGNGESRDSSSPFGNGEDLDLRRLVNLWGNDITASSSALIRGLVPKSTSQLKGLLEVEPLHFVCLSASDGTRLEAVHTGTCKNRMMHG